ncbi:MAG: fumarylacetoacetate hydrolase family protein, partial [Chloroflexota bacterium]
HRLAIDHRFNIECVWVCNLIFSDDDRTKWAKSILGFGETMQDSNTQHMVFKVPYLVAYLSQTFTLLPGDIILTGTPAGVGKGMNPPRFLADGDEVSVTIEGIGTLTNPCKILD